jgi:hypothetical protein
MAGEAALETESTVDTSLHDDLANTISALEGEIENDDKETAVEEVAPQETEAEVPETEAQTDEPVSKPVAQPEEPAKSQYTPPIDWSPTLKNEFKDLPEQFQKAIHDREVAVNNVFQQTAGERRTAQSFNQIVTEFSGLMAAEGVQDPLQGVKGLLMTTAQLAMGTPQAKAQKIADLIGHYGVDIATLDSMLAGEEQPAQNTQLEQMLNQRLAPVDQLLQQINQGRQTQQQQVITEANQTIHEFGADPANEFFQDVRLEMADFLDIAAKRGQTMTLKQAYDRACSMNSEIAGIISNRRVAEQAATAQQNIGGKRAAGSSISGTQGHSEVSSDGSLRSTLEEQFNQARDRI